MMAAAGVAQFFAEYALELAEGLDPATDRESSKGAFGPGKEYRGALNADTTAPVRL